jgi:hypothetical protein
MLKAKHISLLLLILGACTNPDTPRAVSLINTAHLEHLYQEVTINEGLRIGTIWIYSNAPDYQLVTDDDEGFTCVDDVSRALVFYCRQYKRFPVQKNLDMIKSLTRFIMYMKADNGYYYNFMFPDNGINAVHPNSRPIPAFWSWRVFWALSELNLLDAPEFNELKIQIQPFIHDLLINIEQLFSQKSSTLVFDGVQVPSVIAEYGADQVSLIMISLTNYYQVNNSPVIKELIMKLGHYLMSVQLGDTNAFPYYAFMSWKNLWHAWGNMEAYALLYAGRILENDQFILSGLNEVEHFYSYCIEQNFLCDFRITRENDSLLIKDLHRFPQISYGITPMIYASLEAYNITDDETYSIKAGSMATWYFGNNPANQVMYDHSTGRTFDGIDSTTRTNFNSGAESTIEALLGIQAIESDTVARDVLMEHFLKTGSVSGTACRSREEFENSIDYMVRWYKRNPERWTSKQVKF